MKSPSNFERLVLGCIDSYDSNQILIFSGFSRSTRFSYFCTAPLAKFQQIFIKLFANFASISKEIRKILHFKMRFHRDFRRFSRKFLGFSQIFQKMPNYITIPRSFADFSEKTFKKAEFSGHGYAKKSDSVNHIPSVLYYLLQLRNYQIFCDEDFLVVTQGRRYPTEFSV